MMRPLRIRTLMAAVAIVGLIFGAGATLGRRRARFLALARYHRSHEMDGAIPVILKARRGQPSGQAYFLSDPGRRHFLMAKKYERAGRRPWLAVDHRDP